MKGKIWIYTFYHLTLGIELNLVSPYSCGEIINLDKDEKLVIVKMENDEIRTSKNAIKK